MKRIFLLVIPVMLVFLNSYSLGDCPHCYTMAKVEIRFKDGNNKIGYAPIYGSDSVTTSDTKEGGSQKLDIKDELIVSRGDKGSIIFVKDIYSFKNIGNMVIKEDMEKIPLDETEKITLISWVRFSGAGEVSNLPKNTIKKLKAGSYETITIHDSCEDTIYINLNPNISKDEFNAVIKYSPHFRSEFVYMENFNKMYYDLMNYDKKNITKENMFNSIQGLAESEEKKVQMIPITTTSTPKGIAVYLTNIRDKYLKRLHFYRATILYLRSNEKGDLVEFIDIRIEDKELQKKLQELLKSFNDNKDILSNIKNFTGPLYKELEFNYKYYHESFNSLLNNNDIVIFIDQWD
ncbi:MAG: hypothetical protein COS17_06260 [Elusimicrobia bacterium CG02_land_8_20_14_3_00_37_13]|nr:MAG: hypothetical protein COS17_06260 [Elusimicrobia bacterium CG02_land_8_20_14_3_00_37_13]